MKSNLPVLLLKNMVLFPYNEIRIEFDSDNDKKLLSLAESCYDNNILIVNPSDSLETNPEIDELPTYGIIGKIKMKLDMPNGKTRIIILGEARVKIFAYSKDEGIYEALYSNMPIEELTVKEEMAYVRALNKHIDVYVREVPYMSNTILSQTAGINNIDKLTDIVVLYLPVTNERKQEYLKESSSTSRVKMILDDINKDIEILRLEQKIETNVALGLEQSQKEFVLREKIKAIHEELGDEEQSEFDVLKEKINELDCPEKVKEKLLLELNKYSISNSLSPETGMIRNYIDWLLNLPWNTYTEDRKDLKKVREILDSTHYGLDNVKDRVIEYLAVKQNTNNLRSPIICLVGPPGVGKTTFAKNIAKSLNRKVTKISVGGINDEAEIIGHRRAYIGAAPGLIIQGMKKAGTKNPVFIIDEIDKMTKDLKGDPASSLLEVLDKEQNERFVDHFVEEEFDLSKVMFILTANYIDKIPHELRDRLEIIELSSYTVLEKVSIAKNYILKKMRDDFKLTEEEFFLTEENILTIINKYTRESGVRELERLINKLGRKYICHKLLTKEKIDVNEKIVEFLGREKYSHEANYENSVGVVNALSYNPMGGQVVKIESTFYEGNGKITSSGQLGDVMQESISLAFAYIKSHTKELNVDFKMLTKNDFYLHMPGGSSKKEGPSAGCNIVTSLLSSIKGKVIPNDISMTGEISLTGKVLRVGGLKEKIIAALSNDIKKVYVPLVNREDMLEIEEIYHGKMEIVFVDNYLEIYKDLFK